MGYKELESYPGPKGHFWGRNAKEFSKISNDSGLKLVSTHISLGLPFDNYSKIASLENGFQKFVEEFATSGGSYIVCPYIDGSLRNTVDDYSRIVEKLNIAGEICQKAGIQFCYHNHDFEFRPINDIVPYHHLLTQTDKDLVKMELDIYWASKAQQSIDWLFKEFPGRFPLVHVKDLGKEKGNTVEVGSGTIDFKFIFAMSRQAGIKHYFVEQDNCPGDPLVSVDQSLRYLKKFRF
jgi:sugar phosphate isomerase/epimerase